MNDTIDMVKCCYCSEEWCREEDELTCGSCTLQVEVDIALFEIKVALEVLKKADSLSLATRHKLIREISKEYRDFVETLLPQEGQK